MPVRIVVTEGTRADCKEAIHLIEGISAEALLADRGYASTVRSLTGLLLHIFGRIAAALGTLVFNP